jgi:hypothetical protein
MVNWRAIVPLLDPTYSLSRTPRPRKEAGTGGGTDPDHEAPSNLLNYKMLLNHIFVSILVKMFEEKMQLLSRMASNPALHPQKILRRCFF